MNENKEVLYMDKYTQEEWEEPVFPNGPSREIVEGWKQDFGQIYMVPFEGQTFIVRGLMRPEFRAIQMQEAKVKEEEAAAKGETVKAVPFTERLVAKFDNEERVAAICTLFPSYANSEEYFMKEKAGYAGTIADIVFDKSCFRYIMPPVPL